MELPIELGWTPKFGPNRLLGRYKIGYVYDTSNYKDFLRNTAGAPIATAQGQPLQHDGRSTFFILTDQMIYRTGPHDADGIFLLANYSHENPNTAFIEQSATVGACGRLGSGEAVRRLRRSSVLAEDEPQAPSGSTARPGIREAAELGREPATRASQRRREP